MNDNDLVSEELHSSAIILANAASLGSALVRKVVGNDISDTLNGTELTRDAANALMLSAISTEIALNGQPA